jgi:hypothetical protein
MRRSRADRAGRALAAAVILLTLAVAPPAVAAQGVATEGAVFLVLPVGARNVGTGQATVAATNGTEALWANPAGLGWQARREIGIHHAQLFAGTGTALAGVVPVRRAGTFAASVYLVNYGEQEITDGGGAIGRIAPANVVWAATYAAPLSRALSVGLTFKVVQFTLGCSGSCPDVSTFNASTSAVDLGAQWRVAGRDDIVLGAAVRHLGLRLQVKDEAQSDPLPTRVDVGAWWRVRAVERAVSDVQVRVGVGGHAAASAGAPSLRLGAEARYRDRFFVRAGYAGGDGEGTGPAIGLGAVFERLQLDLARSFGGIAADAGQAPFHFTLRFVF